MVAKPLSRREIFARVKRGVVGIAHNFPEYAEVRGDLSGHALLSELLTLMGTGFLAHQSGIIVTAGHVVDPWLKQQALFEAGLGAPPHNLSAPNLAYPSRFPTG